MCQAMAKAMEHLTDFVFVSMANTTLLRRDSYLSYLKAGVKAVSSNPERELHPPLSDPAKSHKVSHGHKLLCQSSQEQLPVRGITSAYRQKCRRTGPQPDLPRVFQLAVFGTQTQQQVETHTGPKQTESVPHGGEIQDGDTRNHQNIPPARGMGHLDKFQGCLLPYPNTGTIQQISKISCPGPDIPIQGTPFRSVHSAFGVHCNSKGGETDGHTQGYKNPPVPRRLVGMGHLPPRLSPTYSVRPTPNCWQSLQGKIQRLLVLPACPFRQFMSLIGLLTAIEKQVHLGRLHMRPIQWHLKNNWRIPESLEKVIPIPKSLHPHLRWWLKEGSAPRSTITPSKTRAANLYRRIKRRVGRSLERAHCKRGMVITGKQAAYKLSGTESSIPGSKRVPRPLLWQDSPGSNRQHNGSGLCKQGRRHEVGPTLCKENLDLVYQETSDSQGPTHPRSPKCSSRQTIQTGSDHPDRVVSPSRSLPNLMQQVAPASNRPIRHEVQQQVTSVCVAGTGPPGNSSRCSQSAMGGSGRIRLPTDRHIGQSGLEVTGVPHARESS